MNKISDEKTISEYKRFINAKNPRPKAGIKKLDEVYRRVDARRPCPVAYKNT
jgi:hypothetical protein